MWMIPTVFCMNVKVIISISDIIALLLFFWNERSNYFHWLESFSNTILENRLGVSSIQTFSAYRFKLDFASKWAAPLPSQWTKGIVQWERFLNICFASSTRCPNQATHSASLVMAFISSSVSPSNWARSNPNSIQKYIALHKASYSTTIEWEWKGLRELKQSMTSPWKSNHYANTHFLWFFNHSCVPNNFNPASLWCFPSNLLSGLLHYHGFTWTFLLCMNVKVINICISDIILLVFRKRMKTEGQYSGCEKLVLFRIFINISSIKIHRGRLKLVHYLIFTLLKYMELHAKPSSAATIVHRRKNKHVAINLINYVLLQSLKD